MVELLNEARRWLCLAALGLAALALVSGLATGRAEAAPRLALIEGAEAAQLHEALQISLQPWSFEVVDWPRPAGQKEVDAAAVGERANARYVIWYDAAAAELVVYDAELRREERRALAALPVDEVEASALALSIKTMLRLEAVPREGVAAPAESRWGFHPALGLGVRFGLDGDAATALRAQARFEVAPPRLGGLRLGVMGEVGSATEVSDGNFRGEWSEWSLLASVSKQVLEVKGWALTARAAAGVSRATLSGMEMRELQEEAELAACGMASVSAGRRLGPLMMGVGVAVAARGTSEHFRNNGQVLWTEPSLLAAVMATVELAR